MAMTNPTDWLQPLGDYEPFRSFGRPRRWGGGRAWFGGGIIDGLCDVLDEHLSYRDAAAIGCVYRLNSQPIIDRLTALTACCIVVDKRSQVPSQLIHCGRPFQSTDIEGLRTTAASKEDAAGYKIWAETDLPEHDLGPVRLAGYGNRTDLPSLHAKILVLGHRSEIPCGPDADKNDYWGRCFEPQTVWFGSANWTAASSSHLEFGLLCDDPVLTQWATEFVVDVIKFSEPAESECAGPEPNLVEVSFDPTAGCDEMAQDFDDECD
jgi:hypothetical protein